MSILESCLHHSPTLLAGLLASLIAPTASGQDTDRDLVARREAFHQAGVLCPLTLHPIQVLGRPSIEAAQALGLVLERYGMPELEVCESPFHAGEEAWSIVAARFGEHLAKLGAKQGPRYHLYAEFLGTPKTGPEEVRFVVVDREGKPVWIDQQKPGDKHFDATAGKDPDPLGCATLVAVRLFHLADWSKAAGTVRDGKFSRQWREKAGVPDKAELAAMADRLTKLRQNVKTSRLAVLPTLALAKRQVESSQRIADLLAQELQCKVTAQHSEIHIEVRLSSNEQRRLWDLARGLRQAVRNQPVQADYALVADLGIHPESGIKFLHLALCTSAGELVLVDMQNDQNPLLQNSPGKSLQDAERLVATRMVQLLRD